MAFEEVSAIRCEHSCADTRGRATRGRRSLKRRRACPRGLRRPTSGSRPGRMGQPGGRFSQPPVGQSVTKGMLFDFLGNFGVSAGEGFPIFQLGGGLGYVWDAHFDENGKAA
jgi:hypothetical protein